MDELLMDELLKLYFQPAVVAVAERVERELLAMWDQFNGECPYVCGTINTTNAGAPDWEVDSPTKTVLRGFNEQFRP